MKKSTKNLNNEKKINKKPERLNKKLAELELNENLTSDIFLANSGMSKKEFEKLRKLKERENKKNLTKTLLNDTFSKNIILARKSIKRKEENQNKQNNRRVKRCNSYLLSSESDYRDIFLTIDKFNNNGKKTIVYFADSFYPCIDGVLSVMESYIKYMQQFYNVVVCAPKHKQKCYKVDDYFVLYADSIYFKGQGYDLAFPQVDAVFQKYISLLKIDLIHLQSPFNMGTFGLALAKKRKIPCFATFHSQFKLNVNSVVKNDVIASWVTKIIMNVFEKSTLALTMNPFARNIMREYGMKKYVEIVPNATNLVPKTFFKEQEEEIVSKHKIDKSKFNMIFVGRFVAVKNVYFLIDVLYELHKINKDFNFIFLGYGPEMSKMQKKCSELGLKDIVRFTGKIDDEDEKAMIIKNADLMFFPSKYEIDSIVRIEAACYSVPTLCLENTSLSSVMIDDHNGFICKDSKEECVNRLDFLIKNVDFVKKVGKNANLEIYFTWDKSCAKLRELYEEYMNKFHIKQLKKNNKKSQK